MRFSELRIETRRELPARARTDGERLLIRAGYVDSAGKLTRLGELAHARLRSAVIAEPGRWAVLGPALTTSNGETVVEAVAGDFAILRCPQCGYADACYRAPASDRRRPRPNPCSQWNELRLRTAIRSIPLRVFSGFRRQRRPRRCCMCAAAATNSCSLWCAAICRRARRNSASVAGELHAASHDQIAAAGAVPGYASPVGLGDAQIMVDELIPLSPNLVAGGNEPGFHLLNTNYGRDYTAERIADLTLARAGDPCPDCASPLQAGKGYVVADVAGFRAFNALLCLADRHRDEHGLHFPFGMGAFDVHLLHLPSRSGETAPIAAELHASLQQAGIPVLYDDRDERAGVKFNDADLIGCPVRITVGEKHLHDRMVELKPRSSSDSEVVPIDGVMDRIQSLSKLPI